MANIIDGKKLATELNNQTSLLVQNIIDRGLPKPKLVVIQVGENPASSTYVKNKLKACNAVGIECKDIHLTDSISTAELIDQILSFNVDTSVDGILVQLPLPSHVDERRVIEAISPEKDVDGFTYLNNGRLLTVSPSILPCTPAGIVYMLKYIDKNLTAKNAVILGRSNIVGKPVSLLLQRENMNVTMLHSKTSTEDKDFYCRHADVIVVATGQENTLTERHLYSSNKPVIIDVGIHRGLDGKLHGDVSEEIKENYSSWYTPVPGGVGPMTIAMLLRNTFQAYERKIVK